MTSVPIGIEALVKPWRMRALGEPPSIIHSCVVPSGFFTATWNQVCGFTISIFTTVPRNLTGLLESNSAVKAWCANSGSAHRSAPAAARVKPVVFFMAALIILLREGRQRAHCAAKEKGSEILPSEPSNLLPSRSELQLQTELRLPRDVGQSAASDQRSNRRARGIEASAVAGGTGWPAIRSGVDDGWPGNRRTWDRKVRVIEDVKDLGLKREIYLFADPRVLGYPDIGFRIAWSDQVVPSQIADCAICRRREAVQVEPIAYGLVGIDIVIASGRVRHEVRPLAIEGVPQIGLVALAQREIHAR